jgi:alcohol dehydrogenase
MQRKAYKLTAGSIKNLKEKIEDLATPQDNEVMVEVHAIGLNFADVFAIWGLYSATPKGEFVPGLEYSGKILAVGKNVTNVKVGDKIMGITRFGGYATHLNIDSRYVLPLPDGWDFKTGAAYLVQVLTAYYALVNLGNIQDNYRILIHSAAGGVGTLANRLAKKMNAYTIGSVGNSEKID